MKNTLTLLFTVFTLCLYGQSGSFILQKLMSGGGCDPACVTAGVCSPAGFGNQTETISQNITVPANSFLDLTITTVPCNPSTHGLDGGDDLFVNGVKIVDGTANTPVDYNGCFSGGASEIVVPIAFTVNRRDETVLVEWEIFPGAGAGCAPLPVTISSFSAKALNNKAVELNWSTASETDNSHFDIEYSTDGRAFKSIDQIGAAGTTTITQNYRYVHKSPINGLNYYRLKQTDFDGRFSNTVLKVVEIIGDSPISIFPSQAYNSITIDIKEATTDEAVIGIYDVMGRLVLSEVIGEATTRSELNIADLAKGHYFLQLQTGSETYTERFIKMN